MKDNRPMDRGVRDPWQVKGEQTRHCRKPAVCDYYSLSMGVCDYLILEGKRRPCPPGDRCQVKRVGGETDRRRVEQTFGDMPMRRRTTMAARRNRDARLEELYRAGKTDQEMAREAGCSLTVVGRWRRQRKYPSNRRQGRPCRIDYEKVEALYRRGLNDGAIAIRTRCHVSTIQKWRQKENLPPNGIQNRGKEA